MAIDTTTSVDVQTLTPFKKFIMTIGNLPTSYLESMSYAELLMWFCNYLQETVIPTVNNNADAVEELQGLYEELHDYVENYFDDLDVQEEINNKLDQMAENGELIDLIKGYIDPIYRNYENSINAEILSMQNQISNVASGSPAGVYSTVSALTSADPNHNKIYVVTADGKWYYYDTSNSTWTAGGTYQSTEIADNSITIHKLQPDLQNMINNFGINLMKDPNNNGSISYTISGGNTTPTLVDTPAAMTGAISNKSIRITGTASGIYARFENFYKSLPRTITKVSFSAYIYTPNGQLNVLFYNKTAGTVIKTSGGQAGNLFKVIIENIPINGLNDVILALQGTYANPDVYITDITLVEGAIASPSFIAYDYVEPDNNNLTNKNILIFGDSITDCCNLTINSSNQTTAYSWRNPSNSYVNGLGQTVQFSMWPKIIKELNNCKEIRNYAKSGAHWKYDSTASGDNARQNLNYQVEVAINDKLNPNNVFNQASFTPDIIIFALGTNDGTSNDTYESAMAKTVLVSGTNTIDVSNTLANLDLTKFNEAVRYNLLKIKNEWPLAQIYVVLPIQRADRETTNVNEELEKMALRYGAIIINGAGNTGITRELNVVDGLGVYLKDGLHPNEKGQNLLTRTIMTSIKNNYIDFSDMNP